MQPVGWPSHGQSKLQPGDLLGHFEIQSCIGEGGFGVVYLAIQRRPITRKVAIKLLKAEIDSGLAFQRFELERQALAELTHPNIARVYEAGQTDRGRPYVAMEYIDGSPITRHCNKTNVHLRGRLQLFLSICAAVQHAHERGFIHRDLKPANILVAEDEAGPLVKVIDFGVAKAFANPGAASYTQAGQVVGTIDYMSPEQLLSSADIDTRSDVYALGVLLYELLTEERPFEDSDLNSKSLLEAQQIITQADPLRPSRRLKESVETKKQSQASTRSLSWKLVRGDLDWIVMRCLEKDRQRRYDSARALKNEIQRVLENKPVEAGPPGGFYHAQKFVRRHRPLVVSSAIIFVVLIIAVTATSIFAAKESRARATAQLRQQESEQQATRYQAMAQFMEESFSHAMPHIGHQYDTTLLKLMLDASSRNIGERFDGSPLAEAQVRTTFGLVYQSMGRYEEAEDHFRRAMAIRQSLLADNAPEQIQSMIALGILLTYQGRSEEAAEVFERLLAIEGSRDVMTPAEQAAVLICVGQRQLAIGHYDQALAFAIEAQQKATEAYGEFDLQALNANLAVAEIYLQLDADQAAATELEMTLPRLKRIGSRHPSSLKGLSMLALAYHGLGRHEEARRLAQDAMDMTGVQVGENTPQFKDAAIVLSQILTEQGEPQRAIEILGQLPQESNVAQRYSAFDHLIGLQLARAQFKLGLLDSAKNNAMAALEAAMARRGLLSPASVECITVLAQVLAEEGDIDELVALSQKIVRAQPGSEAQQRMKDQAITECCQYLEAINDPLVRNLCQ